VPAIFGYSESRAEFERFFDAVLKSAAATDANKKKNPTRQTSRKNRDIIPPPA
jgi:hypothetical protein